MLYRGAEWTATFCAADARNLGVRLVARRRFARNASRSCTTRAATWTGGRSICFAASSSAVEDPRSTHRRYVESVERFAPASASAIARVLARVDRTFHP